MIWNLLSNAIKFTPAGGRVDVFIESSNDYMEIRVVDTGQASLEQMKVVEDMRRTLREIKDIKKIESN